MDSLAQKTTEQPLLRIDKLAVSFPSENRGRVRAVNGVSYSIYPRQTLAVVGESGCGKSVTALSILKLIPTPPGRYDAGAIHWSQGSEQPHDLLRHNEKQMRHIRGNQIAMIFQEPMTSLNPVYTVGEQILEAILLHQKVNRAEAIAIAERSLTDVGIADPAARLKEYPHQLSGGMRQRVMIAMALACQPRLLLADEPTTALDVTIQAQILELLRKLQHSHNMSILLITHDLGVVAENADVVAVMYAGRVVEYGSVYDIFNEPLHPYTRGLFASMPVLGADQTRLATIPGNVPNPSNFPSGCPFHPRCSATRDKAADARAEQFVELTIQQEDDDATHRIMRDCMEKDPPLHEVRPNHWAACWYAPDYEQAQATTPDLNFRRTDVGESPLTQDVASV